MHLSHFNRLVFLASLLGFISLVSSDCCGGGCSKFLPCPGKAQICPTSFCCDGSQQGPFACCGIGSCNIFCCNCDDGCLGGSDSCPNVCGSSQGTEFTNQQIELRSTSTFQSGEKKKCGEKFDDADENGDGQLSYLEWITYTAGDQLVNLTEAKQRWILFDTDNNGYLEKDEAFSRRA
ncbi:hypothetical protein LY76DRAFT_365940 [Colletotrichum caudatum]|nr:hypothetical protein LY76DRAFT_365940 [Colletotrichum caudatum]